MSETEKKLPLVTLKSGKTVYLDGNSVTSEEALETAKRLFDAFGLHAPRITRHLMYEVQPAIYSSCPHTDSIEQAIELCKLEDEMEKMRKK